MRASENSLKRKFNFGERGLDELRRITLPRLSEKGLSNAPKVDSGIVRGPKLAEKVLLGAL